MDKVFLCAQKMKSILARLPALAIVGCAVFPVALVAIIAQLFAAPLRRRLPEGVDLNIIGMLRHIAHLYEWRADDSWLPMQRALQVLHSSSGNKLYETVFFSEHIKFQYPVTSLLPIEILGKAGVAGAIGLNTINLGLLLANAIAVAALAYLIISGNVSPALQGKWSSRERKRLALAVGFLALTFYPLLRACVLGQIQVWVDLLFTGAVLCWALGWRVCAGLLLGLASTIKPQFGLLFAWGILWREWKFAGGFTIGFFPPAVVAIVLYGIHNSASYLSVLSFLANHGENFFANNSINGLLNWYFSGMDSLRWDSQGFPPYNEVVRVGTLLSSFVFMLPVFIPPLLSAGRNASLTYFGVAAICTVICSPIAWEHHYGILLPLYLIAIRNALQGNAGHFRSMIFGALVVSWSLVANFIPMSLLLAHTKFVFVQAYCFYGAVVLLGVLLATAPNADRRRAR